MRLTRLSITNFRALRQVSIPLSRFGCLIGENNAGKSSFLQALAVFFSGTKLATSQFFDESQPIRIAITFEGIDESDLARLAEEHRARVAGIVKNGELTLVRQYDTTGKSYLLYNALTPRDPRFSNENIGALLKNGRPGQALVDKVTKEYPELGGVVDTTMNQDAIRQTIQELADLMPDEQKFACDQPLPTGIDRSISPMLPEPIYIPAVKDLGDDIKTSESTPFGKILGILLQAIESKLPEANELFKSLNEKLNLVLHPDGTIVDERLDEVRLIESTVQKYVRESFSDVALRVTIPPPELKTIFSSARIHVHDGIDGHIDSKGDGLRRAVVFAILRSYVELKSQLKPPAPPTGEMVDGIEAEQPSLEPASPAYCLLFEEPELFLHPKAQQVLFDALRTFAKEHHVLVTTHSPMFFGPGATETFVRLRKVSEPEIAVKPFTRAQPVSLSEMSARDQFQIICFEHNNAAFFADTVVLVEGDSDYLLMPHIAKTLDPSWDIARAPVVFARITGKGNIRRYRDFFSRFGVRTPVIADLDLLVNGFEHIGPCDEIKMARDSLLARVDQLIEPSAIEPTAKEAKSAHASGELRSLWQKVKDHRERLKAGTCSQEEHDAAVETFFAWQSKSDRLTVLMTSTDPSLLALKNQLLDTLRAHDVYVLERGAIEQYYPDTVVEGDKPSRAQDFCAKVATRDQVLACCGEQIVSRNGESVRVKEFELIFEGIFGKREPGYRGA